MKDMADRSTPQFSWSPKRERIFKDCELCYIMHYYTSHKGWVKNSSPESRAAYRWKKSKNIEELMTEEIIEELLNGISSDEKMSIRGIRNNVLNAMNQAFIDSVQNKENWYWSPKKVKMLYELVYDDVLSDELVSEATKNLNSLLKNFTRTKLVSELSIEGNELLEVRKDFKKYYTYINYKDYKVRIYAGVHITHKRNDGKLIATLLKTKKKESSMSQVGAVAKVVSNMFNVDIKKVIVRDEYLTDGTYKDFPLTQTLISRTEKSINDSINEMSQLLVEGNLKHNEFVGFKYANYARSLRHRELQQTNCPMNDCPYCEAVRRDLELYPNGYKRNISILSYDNDWVI